MDRSSSNAGSLLWVAAGQDRFDEQRGLGISSIAFKVCPSDADGLLILENTFHARGGPPRHVHRDQDEWFYAVEGEFLIEIGDERLRLSPGNSVLAPRQVPHVWAHVGEGRVSRPCPGAAARSSGSAACAGSAAPRSTVP